MMTEEAATWETRSQASCSSVRSRTSITESAAAKARAKAEAAKARLAFAEEEANLKLQKAKLEASMEILSIKKETAAAVAEAEALETAADLRKTPSINQLNREIPPLEAIKRTKDYVFNQGQQLDVEHQQVSLPYKSQLDTDASSMHLKPDAKPFIPNQDNSASQSFCQTPQQPHVHQQLTHEKNTVRFEHDHFTPMQPSMPQVDNSGHPSHSSYSNPKFNDSNMNDFVRYLARRELVSTGLLKFNDKPQNYRAWKRSFQSAIHDLSLTSNEEMDLLLKWLGKDSAEHVEQIRAIHINRPDAGLTMIWNRLDQTYGSAEIIEDALFKRIEMFPKITNQDYFKLIKLSDLLSELLAAKDEGDLPGLTFLDTSRGINPILRKLPFNLQEKWASVGSAYKQRHHVSYPPFGYFVEFISQEASVRNDPSFNLNTQEEIGPKAERTTWKSNKHKEVSTHKTEVIAKMMSKTNEPFSKSDDCNKVCLLHKKPHPLRKCRAFREKSIEDRKSFLKENHVCFKCCSSTLHVAKNCTAIIQCSECNSERHPTVLHPGPAPWAAELEPPSVHGGEDELAFQSQVNTQCTQVCGGDLAERSCSKICLVKVYPSGSRDKAKRVYAILDEQSNRSLVTSRFFEVFSDTSSSSPYTLRTCAGVKQVSGRRATGYEVESLDGVVRLPLPSLIECNDIPNNRDEIPTPDVALYHPHLKSLAHLIPEVDPNAPIMLLLGRDMLSVHKVRKKVNGTHNMPYAQKLDLGWVIVGNVCLGNVHKPSTVCTFFTTASDIGRPTLFQPCPNVFHIKERYSGFPVNEHLPACLEESPICEADHLGCSVFQRTKNDNQVVPSIQDRNFLRFLWFEDNDLSKDIVDYRMKVHVFGNSPSPAVAINDDGLKSLPTTEAAISLLKRTQDVLSKSNLRLHKIAANSKQVMEAFQPSDRANDLKELDLDVDQLPMQRSLGLGWNLQTDCFHFSVSKEVKPYTRRGVLSTINSLYNPLGFAAPITIQMKDKLTHEVLTTFMSKVSAIVNARPLVPVTTDPDDSFILTPAALLTQKVNTVPAPAGEFGASDLYKHQWRQVQHLSNTFWDRWRKQFLPTLQPRRKWLVTHPNIKPGSVVLLKNIQLPRNEWPLGLVTQTFPSKDDKVRKVEVKICNTGGSSVFLRPVTEIVILLPPND